MRPGRITCILLTFLLQAATVVAVYGRDNGREVLNFNSGWKFHKGEVQNGQALEFDDSGWRTLDLPHDWSIEGPFSKEYASGTGFLPGGIGWYRKEFELPANASDHKIFIEFDGVYNNSDVWINGVHLGKRPNGYISFRYDLTSHLKQGKGNIIAVRVDHSKYGDSRWYTGSGIYRDVRLIFTPMVHIAQWGLFASAGQVSAGKAVLDIEVNVINETGKAAGVTVSNILMHGSDIVGRASGEIKTDPSVPGKISHRIEITDPALWSIDDPDLYSLLTVVKSRGSADSVTTVVGFRDIRFDPGKGFFLNGKNLKLKGVCIHHDAGTLGSAVPPEVMERRLDILREMGCNAIRTSHNPFSPYFLDLCDRKGFLVIGEAFDEWELPKRKWIEGWNKGTAGKDGYAEFFGDWAKTDLKDMILRDRNHPSVIMWSIGNEIDYPNDPYTHSVLNDEANPQTFAKYNPKLPDGNRLGVVASELAGIVRSLDKTRPVTAGLASALMSNATGYADALDVAGYNYQEFRYPGDHQKYPGRILYGSENGMSLEAWNAVADNDYILGQFLWTGIEYLGEAGQYPSRHSTSGVIDLAGNKKPEFYFRQSLWSDKPMVFIGTTDRVAPSGPENLWSHKRVDPVWNYNPGQPVSVNVFTNCSSVELFLNDRSLGSKKLEDFKNRTISWEVPFEAGTLRAEGRNDTGVAAEYVLKTTGDPVTLSVTCNETTLKADREDLVHIMASLCDGEGNVIYSATNAITCTIEGPVRLLGMEDANPRNTEDYKDNIQNAFHGRMLIYVQSLDKPGKAVITLSSPGLKTATIELDVRKR